ncbi:MAG: GNAT family N-acetyltransferase [Bacteroidetes bacterium]|nr:GNAT family N-acetyltransferase [Bacteroidota bacterium]
MHPVIENKEYTIVRLNSERLKDMEKLYMAVYGISAPQNYFKKKYDTSYTGVEWLGYIAYNKDNIAIAYYGVMPYFMEYEDQIILCAQSGDTMTHPGFRYKGMFVELSKITFELCRENSIRFIFGFPNQNSYHGAVTKLGWKMTESMDCFEIPVSTIPVVSFVNRFKFFKPIYNRYCKTVINKYRLPQTGIPNSVIGDGYAGVYRDEKYFRYKTYSDTMVIRVGKANAWIKIKNELIIGDLELNGENFDNIMNRIEKIAAKLGIKQILFHSSPDTQLQWLFIARYPAVPSFPVLFQDFGAGISFEKIKFTFADIDTF